VAAADEALWRTKDGRGAVSVDGSHPPAQVAADAGSGQGA
jgi:hypothetical protein